MYKMILLLILHFKDAKNLKKIAVAFFLSDYEPFSEGRSNYKNYSTLLDVMHGCHAAPHIACLE